jgi:hypothetical protein
MCPPIGPDFPGRTVLPHRPACEEVDAADGRDRRAGGNGDTGWTAEPSPNDVEHRSSRRARQRPARTPCFLANTPALCRPLPPRSPLPAHLPRLLLDPAHEKAVHRSLKSLGVVVLDPTPGTGSAAFREDLRGADDSFVRQPGGPFVGGAPRRHADKACDRVALSVLSVRRIEAQRSQRGWIGGPVMNGLPGCRTNGSACSPTGCVRSPVTTRPIV